MKVYELSCNDLSGFGGQGGDIKTKWSYLFSELDVAKTYASDYQYRQTGVRTALEWERKRNRWESKDVGFIYYEIIPRKVIEKG